MERFVNGQIVVANFPFNEVGESKRRPALVIGSYRQNILICRISATETDGIPLDGLEKGKLNKASHIIPYQIATINPDQVQYIAGRVSKEKYEMVIQKVAMMMRWS